MKKLYTQPQTEALHLQGEKLCDELLVGNSGATTGGVWGIPVRNGQKVGKLYV